MSMPGVVTYPRIGVDLDHTLIYRDSQRPAIYRRFIAQTASTSNTTIVAVGGLTPTANGSAAAEPGTSGKFVRYTAAAGAGSNAGWTTVFIATRRDFLPVFRVQLRTPTNIADVRVWCGLVSADPSASDTPAVELAAFRYSPATDTTAFWRAVTDNGSGTPTTTNTNTAIAADTRYDLTVDCSRSNEVLFWIGSRLVAPHALTLPTSTTTLGYYVTATNTTVTAKNIGIGVTDMSHL